MCAMKHIQFCTYFFFLRDGEGGKVLDQTTLKICGRVGGFQGTCFQTRLETCKIPELAEED